MPRNPSPKKFGKGDHLYLIDASGYIFRAYHALPPLTRKSDGLPVGAISGFCNMLHKLVKEMRDGDRPTHFASVFDTARLTFRSEIYKEYKAHRPPPPEDLVPQFPLMRDASRAFNLCVVEMDGYEADDLIATYAREAARRGGKATIVSSDKDLMQLVEDGKIELYDPMKLKPLGVAEVMEKFGVPPNKVVEVQALAGDSVDNVPGVPGIGIKTAAELINTYGDLETLLKRAGEIKQPKRRENLIEHAEKARISRKLVLLEDKVPLKVPLDDLAAMEVDPRALIGFLRGMEFNSLTKRVASEYDIENVDDIAATPIAVATVAAVKAAAPAADLVPSDGSPLLPPGAIWKEEAVRSALDVKSYRCIVEEAELREFVARASESGLVAFDTETTSLDAMQAEIVGVSLATAPGIACYIPLTHGARKTDLMGGDTPKQIPIKKAMAILKPLLEDKGVLKVGQNVKYDLMILRPHGIEVAPFDDTMLMSYALDAGTNGHGMDELAEKHLKHKTIAFKDVTGSGKGQITFDKVPLDRATEYAAEDADVTLRLFHLLKPRLARDRMTSVYETLERPLVPVLADMEMAGITIDRETLSRLSGAFAQRMAGLEDEIYKLAGTKFNLGSPKQLGEILYDTMKLTGGKRTATGAWSTDADALEDLAAQGHELPVRILDWRQLQKLKSTYTDALPAYINPHTGRVHTCFSMASTSTGRLSSTDPNLQNIPIRTEEGRSIRTAFVAPKGFKLISADYSQIELRLLAHIADIPQLKKAFAEGLDIHAMTASEMFGVPVKGMPADVRRRAKAINFGIIYGISAFGLANQLGIKRDEADAYIKKYFERFPGIRGYMDRTKEQARKQGYVETIFGRRAHFDNIMGKPPAHRAFMERAAINAPIQGSAADIIRRAMVRVPGALAAKKLGARMLLQVHDELIFEAPDKEVEKTCAVVKEVMEKAALPALELRVPLVVEAKPGRNWDEAH